MRRILTVLSVALIMAAMMVAMATPAFAIPGDGNNETGKHAGYGLAPSNENNIQGDENHSARAVAKDKKGELKGNAYGDYNN